MSNMKNNCTQGGYDSKVSQFKQFTNYKRCSRYSSNRFRAFLSNDIETGQRKSVGTPVYNNAWTSDSLVWGVT